MLALSHPGQRQPRHLLAARQHVTISEERDETAGCQRRQAPAAAAG